MELLAFFLVVTICALNVSSRPIRTYGLRFYNCGKLPVCEPGAIDVPIPCENYCSQKVRCPREEGETPTVETCPSESWYPLSKQANFNPYTLKCDFDFVDCSWFLHHDLGHYVDLADYYAKKIHVGSDGVIIHDNVTSGKSDTVVGDGVQQSSGHHIGTRSPESKGEAKATTQTKEEAVHRDEETVLHTDEGKEALQEVKEGKATKSTKTEEKDGAGRVPSRASSDIRVASTIMLVATCSAFCAWV